ncbi:MAG: hypothetical protein OXI41_03385 [Chloroflexota bacterium]|nr:hypothetical protein [Chloroflexota bacterium]
MRTPVAVEFRPGGSDCRRGVLGRAHSRRARGDKQSHCPRELEAGVERTLFEAERVEAEEQQWDGA